MSIRQPESIAHQLPLTPVPAISGFAGVGPQIPQIADESQDSQLERSVLKGVAVLEDTAAVLFDGLDDRVVWDMVKSILLIHDLVLQAETGRQLRAFVLQKTSRRER